MRAISGAPHRLLMGPSDDGRMPSTTRSTLIAVLAGLVAFAAAVLVVATLRGGDAEAATDVAG
jgi:hypothetical protein